MSRIILVSNEVRRDVTEQFFHLLNSNGSIVEASFKLKETLKADKILLCTKEKEWKLI